MFKTNFVYVLFNENTSQKYNMYIYINQMFKNVVSSSQKLNYF